MQPDFLGVSAIVLAAGLSRRAAPRNKLLQPFDRRPVVRATVEAFCGVGFGEVLVVTGHERERVEAALAGLPVSFVFAPDFARGMGCSLAAGVRAAAAGARGFAVAPGDLPWLTPKLVAKVAEPFLAGGGAVHVIPLAQGERGHPAMLGAWLRPQLEALTGDEGARRLLASDAEKSRCRFFETGNPAVLRDVDRGIDGPAGRAASGRRGRDSAASPAPADGGPAGAGHCDT